MKNAVYQFRLMAYKFLRFGERYQQGKKTFADLARIHVSKASCGSVILGDYVLCGGELYSFLGKGKIRVGNCSYIGRDTRIWALSSVTVGQRVLISHNVFIVDNRTHPLEPESRHAQYMAKFGFPFPNNMALDERPIVIEDDVLIAANAIILRGVQIGAGSIVAAGAVVTKSIPARVVVAGNPARIVRKLA
jgi:acetyltransferase-like isoleucine patch superfamily enzyme